MAPSSHGYLFQPVSSFVGDSHTLKAACQEPSVIFQRLLRSVRIKDCTNTPDLCSCRANNVGMSEADKEKKNYSVIVFIISQFLFVRPYIPVLSLRAATSQQSECGTLRSEVRWRSSKGTNTASRVWRSPPTANTSSVWETSTT